MRRCVFIVGVVILAVGSSSLAHAANEYATFASFYKQDPSSFIIIIGAVVAAAIAAAAILLTGGTGGPIVLALGTSIGNLLGYAGAVATNVGFALLGGGAIAAGGLGMTGGVALLSAALTFGTTIGFDYSIDRGLAEYNYHRLRARSAEMVNLPPVVNNSGSDAYKRAIEILSIVDEEMLLAAEGNARLLEDAIAAVDEDPEAKSQ